MRGTPHGATAYRRIDAESRSPLELTVMLYDGALGLLARAREAVARGDLPNRAKAVSRALEILAALQGTLNFAEGGQIARDLDRLYAYMTTRLVDSTVKRDASALDEVSRLLSTLRSAWAEIAALAPSFPRTQEST
jgi:flagellar protein FliS